MRNASVGMVALACASGAIAQSMPGAPDDRNMGTVASQPLSDVNIKRSEIPPQLREIIDDPYSLRGIKRCRELIAAVEDLNTVLGPDLDTPVVISRGKKRRNSAMTVMSGAISSLIPFRYLIRELTGANKSDNAYRTAIYAGVVRRGFLKGYGKARGCRPPGSPAPIVIAEPPVPTADDRER